MKKTTLCLLAALSVAPSIPMSVSARDSVDLSGRWAFQLDPTDAGLQENWQARKLEKSLDLPGSLQLQGFGDEPSVDTKWTGSVNERSWFTSDRYAPYREPGNIKLPFWLTPERYYVGAAWYQRGIEIPKAWAGRRVVLHLERPHWGTTVWLDDRNIGGREALGVPHEYDLGTAVEPGPHRLTIRVDNRMLAEVGINAHSVTDHTQGNWNGIAGRIELRATNPVWIDDAQVFPVFAGKKARIAITLGNATGLPGRGTLDWVASEKATRDVLASGKQTVEWTSSGGKADFEIVLGSKAKPWDEFSPNLLRLDMVLNRPETGNRKPETHSVVFGLRDVDVKGTQITLNGRPIFLRGTLECCIFPNTGYPPTDVESWKKVLSAARAHGLNHLRFHSWCPPEAAFVAADEMGFYFQVETSAWSHEFNAGKKIDTWIFEETERMIREYGNHPSLLLLAPSNEPGGPKYEGFLAKFVEHWKAKDPRRLYTAGSGWPSIAANQFHVTHRGRAYPVHAKDGETAGDYSATRDAFSVPVVHHEIGQYCVFPNLDEIPKYKGWLKAKNFEIVRDFLEQAGMLNQAKDFLLASGKLQTLFYKEEIEACLRTPGWGGFQLLDLHDFPGQGTALVGVLDPFWDSKGYVTPAEYRRFCAPTVPLARFQKRVFQRDETIVVPVEAAHYGPSDLKSVYAGWRIRASNGKTLASGRLGPIDLPAASVTSIGAVQWDPKDAPAPAACNLEITLDAAAAVNDWNFWVYARSAKTEPSGGIRIATALDADARAALAAGGKVLLLPPAITVAGNTHGSFSPIFWNKLWFPGQKCHTLGLLCDPRHPALAAFPTDFHSDWQWQDLANRGRPMVLDGLPNKLRPIVQVIDDWNSCRKLGLVFEAKLGKGKLLVCSTDLASDLENRPAARQLRASLLRHMEAPSFDPATAVTEEQLATLFRSPSLLEKLGATIKADSAHREYGAARAIDGNPGTIWHSEWEPEPAPLPHHLVLDLKKPVRMAGLVYTPRQDMTNGRIRDYAVFVSADGKNWGDPAAAGQWRDGTAKQTVRFGKPVEGRYVKLEARSEVKGQSFSAVAEIDVIEEAQ